MSDSKDVRLGDEGTIFRITLKEDDESTVVDVSAALTKQIKFYKPDSATVETKDAAFTNGGADGKIQYVGEVDFIDEIGVWKVQAYVVLPTGKWHSSTGTFTVVGNL